MAAGSIRRLAMGAALGGLLVAFAQPTAFARVPRACKVGMPGACGSDAYCVAEWREARCPTEGLCQPYLPAPRDLVLSVPIPAGERIYCAKGPLRVGASTHSACDPATRFAIDLASTAADRPHLVLAPAGGIVRTFGGCPTEDLNRQETPSVCNYGFGNVVRVEHAPGLYSQIAHLSSIVVDDGARVRRGDVLGIEGNSGNAGAKHLHFSLHRGAARVLLPGPTLPIPALRIRAADGSPRTIRGLDLRCGDFEQNRFPDPATLLESDNVVGRKPPARFGYQRWIDVLAEAAVSIDREKRLWAVSQLRARYDEPTAPYWIALAYLRSRDTITGEEQLNRALRRAERGEGPRWLRPWCLAFLAEVAIAQGRNADARSLFQQAMTIEGSKDPGLRARVRSGLRRINAP
jgi:hypothetical protein